MMNNPNNSNQPVIEVSNLCFGYGNEEVLHNVSFTVNPAELIAVVGPNGGGKTTLLKLILGELQPWYGTIRIFNKSPEAARYNIGYVPQTIPFDPRFPVSVEEVVLMGRVAETKWGVYAKHDRIIAATSLQQVGMDQFATRAFAALSGGERQRVMIAQALMRGAELLLFDEPAANVDPQHATQLYNLFHDLIKQGITIIMVSHHLGVVTAHANRILCINRTAGIHSMGEVASATFTEAFGGVLTTIHHNTSCHVVDPSNIMSAPHMGAAHNKTDNLHNQTPPC